MKSKKSSGFARRKAKYTRPLARSAKHKKSAPSVRNIAATVARGEKGAKKAIFEQCAAMAREKLAKKATTGGDAAPAMDLA